MNKGCDVSTNSAQPSSGLFPMWYDLLAILGMFFVSQMITLTIFNFVGWSDLSVEALRGFTSNPTTDHESDMGRLVFIWTCISQAMMLFFVIIYRAMRRGKWGTVGFSYRGFNPTILLWGLLMILSLNVVMDPILSLFPDVAVPVGRGIYMILAIVVLAPIFEELICRGIVLEAVRRKHGAWMGCLASALVFGFMHIQPQLVINAFACGLILGYIYLRTRSIFAPIILHSINNLLAYIFIIFGISRLSLADIVSDKTIYFLIYCASVGVVILSVVAISKRLKQYDEQMNNSMHDQAEEDNNPI